MTVLTYCFLSLGLMLTKLWVSHTASTCTMDTVVVKNEDGNRWMMCQCHLDSKHLFSHMKKITLKYS